MKKKISLNDWTYIGKYNPVRKIFRPLCNYSLIQDERGFIREVKLNLIAYILIVIPVHLVKIIYLLWDGGLKEFEFDDRHIGYDVIGEWDGAYPRAEEIWNKR